MLIHTGSMDATILVWDVSDPASGIRPLATLAAHLDSVDAVAIVGDRLFSASQDHSLRVWA